MKRQGSPDRPGTGEGDRLSRRGRLLWRLGHRKKGRAHRYFRWRIAAFVLVHALIAWVPLSGTFRFDFWQGKHLLFGEPVDLLTAFQRFVIPFGLVNIGIVLVVRWTGRFLCGWVCPVNFMNRWGDWLRGWNGGGKSGKSWRLGLRGQALALGSSLLFPGLFSLWFVDPCVYVAGRVGARLGAGGLWAGLAAVSYGQLTLVSWRTCKRYCPSGVYFSVLGPKTFTGIERRAEGHACEDCSLCATACPMELEPRGETATLGLGFLRGTGSALPETTENDGHAEKEKDAGAAPAREASDAKDVAPGDLRGAAA